MARSEDKVREEEEEEVAEEDDDADYDCLDLEDEMKQIALKDRQTNLKSRPFSSSQIPGEGKFEESMRRIRELTSRSIQRYQTSTKTLKSSLRAGGKQGSSLSGLRLKVRPSENGVRTTMIIDGRSTGE